MKKISMIAALILCVGVELFASGTNPPLAREKVHVTKTHSVKTFEYWMPGYPMPNCAPIRFVVAGSYLINIYSAFGESDIWDIWDYAQANQGDYEGLYYLMWNKFDQNSSNFDISVAPEYPLNKPGKFVYK